MESYSPPKNAEEGEKSGEFYYCHFEEDEDEEDKREKQRNKTRHHRVRSNSDRAKLEQMTDNNNNNFHVDVVDGISRVKLSSPSPTPLMHSAASVSSEGRGRTLFELSLKSSASSVSSMDNEDFDIEDSESLVSAVSSSALSHVSAWGEMEQFARHRADKLCPEQKSKELLSTKSSPLPTFSLAEVRLGALLERGTFTQVQEVHGFLLRSSQSYNMTRKKQSQQQQRAEKARADLAKTCREATIRALALDKQTAAASSSPSSPHHNRLPYSLKRLSPRLVRAAASALQTDQEKSAALFWTGLVQMVVESRLLQQLEHSNIIQVYGLGHCATATDSGTNNHLDPFHSDFFLILDGMQETLHHRIHKQWKTQLQALYATTTAAPSTSRTRRRRQPGERGKKSLSLPLLGGGRSKSNSKNKGGDFFTGGDSPNSSGDTTKNKTNDFLRQRLSDARDVSDALAYLHSKSICHRDIKPENTGYDVNGLVKVFDFGLARTLPKSTGSNSSNVDSDQNETFLMSQMTGTLRYMAPEVVLGKRYSQSCDTYSFAMVLWEMLTCQTVFGEYITSSNKEHADDANSSAKKNKQKRNKKKSDKKKEGETQDPKRSAQALIQKVAVDKGRPPLYNIPLPTSSASSSSSSSTPSLSLPWSKGPRRQEQQQAAGPASSPDDPSSSTPTISLSPGCQVILGRAWHDDMHERWSMREVMSKLDAEIHRLRDQPQQQAPLGGLQSSAARGSSDQGRNARAGFFTVHEGVEATPNDTFFAPPPTAGAAVAPAAGSSEPTSLAPSSRFLRPQNRTRSRPSRGAVPATDQQHYPMSKQTTPNTTDSVDDDNDLGNFFQAPPQSTT